jgi:hypothetical protein
MAWRKHSIGALDACFFMVDRQPTGVRLTLGWQDFRKSKTSGYVLSQ